MRCPPLSVSRAPSSVSLSDNHFLTARLRLDASRIRSSSSWQLAPSQGAPHRPSCSCFGAPEHPRPNHQHPPFLRRRPTRPSSSTTGARENKRAAGNLLRSEGKGRRRRKIPSPEACATPYCRCPVFASREHLLSLAGEECCSLSYSSPLSCSSHLFSPLLAVSCG